MIASAYIDAPRPRRKKDEYLHVKLEPGGFRVSGMPSTRLGQVELPECVRAGQEIFGEWQWDGSQVIVRTCRFGFLPLFYYATEDEFGVSSSVQRLLQCGAPAELDDAAVATLLRLGWLAGNDTVFRAIRVVPPSGEVRWAGGRLEISGGYSFPKPQRLPRAAAIEGFGTLFRQAIRRRASPSAPGALPLSGGRDSRHILLELNAMGCRPNACFTTHDFPPYREGNIRAAAMLCSRLNIPHQVVGQPKSRLIAETWKNESTSFGALEHAWWVHLLAEVSRSASIFYDGLAGDVLSAGQYLKKDQAELFERGEIAALARRLVDQWSWTTSDDALARILPQNAMSRFPRELAIQRVAQELPLHLSAANPLSSFYFWNRTRRCVALGPLAIAPDAGVMAITPYLDHDLFDFLASFTPEMLMDGTLHTETIHRMHPEFRDIPFDNELAMPLVEDSWHQRRFLAETSHYVALNSRGELIKRREWIRRALGLVISKGENLHKRATSWIAPLHAVYLTQLEALYIRSPRDHHPPRFSSEQDKTRKAFGEP